METVKKAVFFDRDGVLNQLVERDGSLYSPQKVTDFHISPDSIDVIKKLKMQGYLVIVVSNQPDIARVKLEPSDLAQMTQILINELNVDDVFYCIHDDIDNCDCRKPKPGLFHLAQQKYNINLDSSIMVGDTWKDVDAAKNANIKMFLINNDYNQNIQNVERIDTLSEILTKL